MMTWEDEPTIRNAIQKRLGVEPGVKIADIVTGLQADCISVGVLMFIDPHTETDLIARARFDLPPSFEHQQLLNEIDEICEQVKAIRLDFHGRTAMKGIQRTVSGTGLRGRWPSQTSGDRTLNAVRSDIERHVGHMIMKGNA